MASENNTFCTIYKNSGFTHRINYITVAVKFQDKWLFLKSEDTAGYKMINGTLKNGEQPENAIRRELYNKAGIVAAQVYEVAIYSITSGHGRFKSAGRTSSYGKLFFADCVCLGKMPKDTPFKVELLEELPSDAQYINQYTCAPLMRKITNWLASNETENITPYAFEKLCGAVTYCNDNGVIKYILIKNLSGHIGFPKGHAENHESELDTAKREVFEETGLKPQISTNFRHFFTYTAPGIPSLYDKKIMLHKTAVYFTAKFESSDIPNIKIQEEEVLNWWLVPYEEAIKLLNKHTDKRMLELANNYISQTEK